MYELYCEDCIQRMKKIDDKTIDLVIIDPPYEIETSGGGIYKQKDKKYIKELYAMKNGFSDKVLDELCRIMKQINIYIFCSQKQIYPLLKYFVEGKKCNYNILSWHKSNPIPACGNKYLTDTEYILFFREKGVKLFGNFNTKRTYYVSSLNIKDKKKYNHPTVKPICILQNLVINSSSAGDIILDCFMGSGSTGEVSVLNDRSFIGIEINNEYFQVAKQRIEEAYIKLHGQHN